MFDKNIFAMRIYALRTAKGVPQTTLATLLGVTRTQISDLENARTTTSIERLIKLAEYFSVSIDYLVGRTDNPEVNR